MIFSQTGARDTGVAAATGHQRPQNRKLLFFRVILIWFSSFGKLLPCDAGDHGARVCWHDLKFIPVIVDHEEGVGLNARSNRNLVSTGAIGVDRIGAGR